MPLCFAMYGNPGAGKAYVSSLVVDSLCDEARGQNTAVACFYFDYTTQKEQSLTSMLGPLLKQVVGGLEGISEKITRAFRLRLPEIVEMLQIASSSQHTFICVDSLDECVEDNRPKVLGSPRQILLKSPGIRISLTGRAHVRAEVGKSLSGRIAILVISPRREDISKYLRVRLDEDVNSDAMEDDLETDIMRRIPETDSEM
ncbi:hypothetical protein L873DRAFT_1758875 [Choiromyces venosus 120613-1]|uniref:Nephrocystin 3-like N-terminal domain-containing protein n=1 Tax=Choiromyces venosus 120613-1 TaxID=1336337 RepID=A0A3N4K5A2_9PEZI|nr:hypothetical protein L873DRAFT_1758875 [Choiromyces venosus 120613-1]